MRTMSNRAAENFIGSFLTFKPDAPLELFHKVSPWRQISGLVAAGEEWPPGHMKRRGTLKYGKGENIIRVFDDPEAECYRLYFISQHPEEIQFNIIFPENRSDYFLVNAEGQAVIPKTKNIDPLKDSLSIARPRLCFKTEGNEIRGRIALVDDQNNRLDLSVEDDLVHVELKSAQDQDSAGLTKLLVITAKKNADIPGSKLVSLHRNLTRVKLPDLTEQPVYFCLYN